MKKQQAIMQWVVQAAGGRQHQQLTRYSAPAKFQGWSNELWSLNVELLSGFHDQPGVHRVMVWFLADIAPAEMLQPGIQFALYEGTKIVAVGACI